MSRLHPDNPALPGVPGKGSVPRSELRDDLGKEVRLRLFLRPEPPRVQMTSVGQLKFLSLCGFSGASNGTVCARL